MPEPELPEDVRAADLDRAARSELRTLSKDNADAVARHLVVASRLIDDDPVEAHRHALAAARRAGRVAVVRESVAITAYAIGEFALALRELRTFRRISGSDDQIGLMVDSERGVGRPDRALELGRSVDPASLPLEARAALAIAMSGARLDLGDPDAALAELERMPLDLDRVHPWSPAFYDATAAVLEDLGRGEDAAVWRRRGERAAEVLADVDEEGAVVSVTSEAASDDAGEAPAQDGGGAAPPAERPGTDRPEAEPTAPGSALGSGPGPEQEGGTEPSGESSAVPAAESSAVPPGAPDADPGSGAGPDAGGPGAGEDAEEAP